MDRDEKDYVQWLADKGLKPTRRQRTIWLVIWRASRDTLPKEPERHWFAKLLDLLG